MRNIYFDIETTPRSESELIALMSPEVANPIMPAELDQFQEPDLTKCPAYGGDKVKQDAWKEKITREAKEKFNQAREDWQMKATDAKAKFIADAALHAERGQVKVMSTRENGQTNCFIVGATDEEKAKINAAKSWPCKVVFTFVKEEKLLLDSFHSLTLGLGTSFKARLVGYYIIGFDFPFLLRRQCITGSMVSRHLLRTPRYFDEDFYVDLHEAWTLGDKQVHTGGLAGLSKILGVKEKQGSGEGFFRLWRDDVLAALLYHLEEMSVIEQCAKKMGI